MTDVRSLGFEPHTGHLAGVRDFIRAAAESLGSAVDPEVLAVVAGELAANAAIHQSGRAEITIALVEDGGIEVSVTDGDHTQPRLVAEEPWSSDGHRGIQLVAALAHSWGVEASPDGKRVWARLPPASTP